MPQSTDKDKPQAECLVSVGPPVPMNATARDIADLIYAEAKRLYEQNGKLSSYQLQQIGARTKYLVTHLHGKLAGK